MRDCITMCFDICTINIRVSIRVRGLHLFSFLAVFPLPESYQNDPKFHFNTLLRSDTQKSSKNVENTTVFWSRCETVFGPPPAKADIATAILTNVIEHLVLLLPPNKHAFTAKAVWADLKLLFLNHFCIHKGGSP